MSTSNGSPASPPDAATLYAEDLSSGPGSSPRKHLHTLWRRKWFILGLAVLLSGAAYAYYQTQPSQYRATTALLLNETERSDRMTKFLPVQASNRIGRALYFLRNSEVFAQRVAHQLLNKTDTLAPPADASLLWTREGRTRSPRALAARLTKAVSVQRDAKELPALRIQVTSSHPAEAALVANTYADTYRRHLRRSSNARLRTTRQLLRKQKQKMHAQLRALEDSIATRVRASGQRGLLAPADSGLGIVGETNQLAGKIAELRHQKEDVKLDLKMERALLDSAQARLRRIRPNLADRAASTTPTRLRRTQENIASLKADIRLIRARNKTLSPRLEARLSEMKMRLDTLRTRADRLAQQYVDQSLSANAISPLGGESGGGLASVVDLRQKITKRRLSVTRLSAKLEVMNDRLEEHRAALRDAPDRTLARLRRRKATTQELFVALSKNLQRTQVSATASPEQAEVLRTAEPPSAPIAPDVWNKVILAALLGGGGGRMWAYPVLRSRRRRHRDGGRPFRLLKRGLRHHSGVDGHNGPGVRCRVRPQARHCGSLLRGRRVVSPSRDEHSARPPARHLYDRGDQSRRPGGQNHHRRQPRRGAHRSGQGRAPFGCRPTGPHSPPPLQRRPDAGPHGSPCRNRRLRPVPPRAHASFPNWGRPLRRWRRRPALSDDRATTGAARPPRGRERRAPAGPAPTGAPPPAPPAVPALVVGPHADRHAARAALRRRVSSRLAERPRAAARHPGSGPSGTCAAASATSARTPSPTSSTATRPRPSPATATVRRITPLSGPTRPPWIGSPRRYPAACGG